MTDKCICPQHHYKDDDGYPRMKYNKRLYRGNRLIYELVFGEIPQGLVVAHRCNNPGCLNPNHFYLTTPAINSTHAARDGLYRKDDEHPKMKYNLQSCLKMHDMYHLQGQTQQSIGDIYGLSQARVSYCIKRAQRHLNGLQ